MHNNRNKLALLLCVTVQLTFMPAKAASLEVKTLVSDENAELYGQIFVPKTSKIAFVRKLHEPDFHEAESFSESELQKIHGQKDTNPRWADPEVTLVDLDGRNRQTVDFGWSPEPSSAGDKIYYVHQKKPISGLRVLAKSQEGNELFVFDRASGEKKLVVAPTTGYIDNPISSPSGDQIAYSLCDATNGEWGGAVGVGVYDTTSGAAKTLLEPAKHFKLFDLIGSVFWQASLPASENKSHLVCVRQTPQAEGTFLSDRYVWELLNLTDGSPKTLYKKKVAIDLASDDRPEAALDSNGLLSVRDGKITTTIDKATGKTVCEKVSTRDTKSSGIKSPDGLFEVLPSEGSLVIRDTKTGKKMSTKLAGKLQSIKWSPDSSCLAAVITKNKGVDGEEVFDRDSLILVSIPARK